MALGLCSRTGVILRLDEGSAPRFGVLTIFFSLQISDYFLLFTFVCASVFFSWFPSTEPFRCFGFFLIPLLGSFSAGPAKAPAPAFPSGFCICSCSFGCLHLGLSKIFCFIKTLLPACYFSCFVVVLLIKLCQVLSISLVKDRTSLLFLIGFYSDDYILIRII